MLWWSLEQKVFMLYHVVLIITTSRQHVCVCVCVWLSRSTRNVNLSIQCMHVFAQESNVFRKIDFFPVLFFFPRLFFLAGTFQMSTRELLSHTNNKYVVKRILFTDLFSPLRDIQNFNSSTRCVYLCTKIRRDRKNNSFHGSFLIFFLGDIQNFNSRSQCMYYCAQE